MGWWNESVYGGDAAVEWRTKIYKLCGVDEYGKDNKVQAMPKEVLAEKIEDIKNLVNETEGNDKNIGYQVIGAIVIHSGYDFSETDGLQETVITSIEEDQWSKENPVRDNAMKNFKKVIKEYDFSEPVDITMVNVFEENEDNDEEIAKEFKEVFSILNGRMKKLESGIEEKSGNKEYDEGFADAASEEIDFLRDFKELLQRQEMMGILLERISKGLIDSNPLSSGGAVNETAKTAESSSANPSGKDVAAG